MFGDEPAIGCFFEFVTSVDGWDDNGNIFRGNVLDEALGEWNWAVDAGGGVAYRVPEVAVEAGKG